ncbi:RNA 2',3'-cyclic phosphodiesterase [Tissierella sp. Yu-01]|uniref:RNA 2',3'-cyclic phosphodiesterase n=1 Tax=Tissierella sp. Yu-01 TaxID=3035694 RepID=UPI00240E5FFE|nr:RNA 2',3'-cyclic phosphodiesterase [Tissierella sp. Yu-01]WFA08816.1 RNA 2',3'-cyclic phosphodiesterase [Tissierella sp. Yu-01]
MRLFIAINFKETAKDKILKISDEVKRFSEKGKFVNRDHIHLTLEFLGEVDESKLELIRNAMDMIKEAPFIMELSKIGFFKRRDGDIYWLGIKENKSLINLQSELHKYLLEQGFTLEDRPYKPHLTIGRRVVMSDNFNIESYSNQIENIRIEVNKIDLMKSENIKGKLIYTNMYTKILN